MKTFSRKGFQTFPKLSNYFSWLPQPLLRATPARRNSRLGRVRVARFRRFFSPPLSPSLNLALRVLGLQAHNGRE